MGSPWIRRYGLEGYGGATHYLIALQISAGLLTGSEMDLTAGYEAERIYVIVMMLASIIICSMMISQILLMVQRLSAKTDELTHLLRKAKEFMVARKVPQTLQGKVKRYLEYQHKTLLQEAGNDLGFADRLSPWLRLELIEHMNRSVILRHPFFQDLPPLILKRICGAAQTVLTAPGDVIMQRGRRAAFMCFIIRGQLRSLKVKGGKSQALKSIKLKKGKDNDENQQKNAEAVAPSERSYYFMSPSWIGDLSIFQEMEYPNTVLSVTHAELLMITKEALLSIMSETPKVQARFEDYCDKVAKGDLVSAGIVCKTCKIPGHSPNDCAEAQGTGFGKYASEPLNASKGLGKIKRMQTWVTNKVKKPAKFSTLLAVHPADKGDDFDGPTER